MFKQFMSFARRSIFGQVAETNKETSHIEDNLKSHASLIGGQKIILAIACATVLYLGLTANNDKPTDVLEADGESHISDVAELPSD